MKNKLGIYIHFPFCIRKCLYCDFYSIGGATEDIMHRYTHALLAEMEYYAPMAADFSVDTVFWGGGTPTLFPVSDMERVIKRMHELFSIEGDAEITAEANPATADKAKLAAIHALGIGRLSVGVQSFHDHELRALGRAHSAQDACRFLTDARSVGFDNINVDLMYGIPLQTENSFLETLDTALTFAPEHISAYSLIVEEGTPFFQKKDVLPLPEEETEVRLHDLLLSRLKENGYQHYEISNYAKKDCFCRHNLHYWRSEPYLGFGAAAYSFFDGVRYGNIKDLNAYMQAPFSSVVEREVLSPKDLAYENIMLAFRLKEGVDLDVYKNRFGVTIEEKYAALICRFSEEGLMKKEGRRLFLTERGMRFSNAVLVAFLEEDF